MFQLGELIVVAGVSGSIVIGALVFVLKLVERVTNSKSALMERVTGEHTTIAAVDALREEVARLRDVSTQYDMSLQHTLEEMQHRLEVLEARSAARPVISIDEPVQQQVGAGRS